MLSRFSLGLLAAALAFGQTTGTTTGTAPSPATMAQMRVNRLAQMLNLTDAQKTTAIGIYTTAITSAQTLQDQLQTNHDSLRAAVKKNDVASINTLSTAAGVIEGNLMAINAKADAAFYALLTTDQKAIYDAMPGAGRGRGPGGMGGPGMGGGMGGPGGMGGGMMRGRRGQ